MLRIRASSRILAVLGDPVAHSISPQMHNAAIAGLGLDAVYVALRVPADTLQVVLPACVPMGIAGNVTVPLKERAIQHIAHLSPLARSLGAVNTFWPEDGILHGDNTDVAGLDEVLDGLQAPEPWLVLGTGGSARAVAAVAAARHVTLLVRSRVPERAGAFCTWARTLPNAPQAVPDDGRAVGTVINATPRGLAPSDPLPVAPERAAGADVALDFVYRPGETAWVHSCRRVGMRAVDGRQLLIAQGAHAFECFFPGRRAPRELMHAAVRHALRG